MDDRGLGRAPEANVGAPPVAAPALALNGMRRASCAVLIEEVPTPYHRARDVAAARGRVEYDPATVHVDALCAGAPQGGHGASSMAESNSGL